MHQTADARAPARVDHRGRARDVDGLELPRSPRVNDTRAVQDVGAPGAMQQAIEHPRVGDVADVDLDALGQRPQARQVGRIEDQGAYLPLTRGIAPAGAQSGHERAAEPAGGSGHDGCGGRGPALDHRYAITANIASQQAMIPCSGRSRRTMSVGEPSGCSMTTTCR